MRYISSITKNIISVGALEVEGLRGTLGKGILKVSSGSLVVLKGIRRNNVYYLMLAQRPITLVLMMINSCSYSTNDLVFNKFQIFDQDLSQCLASKRFKVKF